jgi:sulfatase modifying factor 1
MVCMALGSCGTPPSVTNKDAPPRVVRVSLPGSLTLDAGSLAEAGPLPDAARGDAASATVARPRYSPRCAAGMREVQGTFCSASSLLHKCVKGAVAKGPEPAFYCDEYEPGFAKCLGTETAKHFCIDEFEHPNVRGALPTVMVTYWQAKSTCEQSGKRLCMDDEWTMACEGPERMPFPYGWRRDSSACNIDNPYIEPNNDALFQLGKAHGHPELREQELNRLARWHGVGDRPRCVSGYGVFDMTGNVDEWAERSSGTYTSIPFKSTLKGGHWAKGARNRCRPETATHDPAFHWYAHGFRCCSEPEGRAARTK